MPQFKVEQIALYPFDPVVARALLADLGLDSWIHDSVTASGKVFGRPGENVADLSFNYQAGNGSDKEAGKPLELEVLHYVAGPNWVSQRMWGATQSTVSHLGMHVTEDQLQEFDAVFRRHYICVAQSVITQSHTNDFIKDSRRYKYVIYDTHAVIGVDLKFIVRLPYTKAD